MLHPFHLVSLSPWPLVTSLNLLALGLSLVASLHETPLALKLMTTSFLLLSLTTSLWIRDILREATFMGSHSSFVSSGLLKGFLLFILSETLIFLTLVWSILFLGLSPGIEVANLWPPLGIEVFNPYGLSLFNTVLLLTSGVSVSWAHHGILAEDRKATLLGLSYTLACGSFFSLCQGYEYISAPFSIQDGCWSGAFYLTTGLHGAHVILGSLFLGFNLIRISLYQAEITQHRGLETGILYWHFVDLIWLLVYSLLYLWT